jgi:hypothetical protein
MPYPSDNWTDKELNDLEKRIAKVFKEAVEATVKERLKGEPPKKGTTGTSSLTKEQIMAIADPELRQKKMLENRHLFNF